MRVRRAPQARRDADDHRRDQQGSAAITSANRGASQRHAQCRPRYWWHRGQRRHGHVALASVGAVTSPFPNATVPIRRAARQRRRRAQAGSSWPTRRGRSATSVGNDARPLHRPARPGARAAWRRSTRPPRCALGALVFDNDYKHPVVLAKETGDDGRAVGRSGRDRPRRRLDDHATTSSPGIPYDTAGVRIDRFVEGLAVIKGVMGPGPFSFTGEHYTITDYDGLPKPVQSPRPPILIGGGGKRVLSIAAREADIVGINGTLHAGVIGPEALATMTAEAVRTRRSPSSPRPPGRRAPRRDRDERPRRSSSASPTTDAPAVDDMAELLGVEPAMIDASPFALIGSASADRRRPRRAPRAIRLQLRHRERGRTRRVRPGRRRARRHLSAERAVVRQSLGGRGPFRSRRCLRR